MKKILYVMCAIQILLGIYLYFIAVEYAYVESVMRRWLPVIIFGILMIYLIYKSNKQQIVLCVVYPIGLIIICILIFTSIPVYSYEEAVGIIENSTGEKSVKPQAYKANSRNYYIYTANEIYLFDPWNGMYAAIPKTD